MRAELTPTSVQSLNEIRGSAWNLVEIALDNGFGERELKILGQLVHKTKKFFGYSSYAKLARDVGVSSRVLSDRVNRWQYPPSLFNYQRVLRGLIRICDRALDDYETGPPGAHSSNATWVPLPMRLRKKATEIGELLAELILIIRGSNDPRAVDAMLGPIHKAQLIATLETALEVLKAPMVEVGLLTRTSRWLFGIGKRAGELGVKSAVAQLSDKVGKGLADLISKIFS